MTGILKKTSYVAVVAIVALAGGLAYFEFSSPSPSAPQVVAQQAPQQMKPDLPNGAILIPVGGGVCKMRALDNTTGQIVDFGIVNCSNASDHNMDAWRRAMSKDRFVEVGKSFRHESDH
jgi:hypothetical protein